MSGKNTLGIIFSNAYDETVPALTAIRAMGSIPYAGRYRLIDFPLSAMVNAGITQVGVITNSNYRSLMDHIGNGKEWDLSRKREGLTLLPPFSLSETGKYSGKLSALTGNLNYISKSGKDYVLIADCNAVCSFDYNALIDCAEQKNADIVTATVKGIPSKIDNVLEYVTDENGKVTDIKYVDECDSEIRYSIKITLLKRVVLERLIHEAAVRKTKLLEDIFVRNSGSLNIYCYDYTGYIKVIDSELAYYEANLDLLCPEVRKNLFPAENPVYTKTGDRTPAIYGLTADVSRSLVADGCKIEGTVENCILFRGVKIGKGSVIRNSILMQDTAIGDNVQIECVITDKDVTVRNGKKLCGADSYPVYISKNTVI